jgi:hypothetical protein
LGREEFRRREGALQRAIDFRRLTVTDADIVAEIAASAFGPSRIGQALFREELRWLEEEGVEFLRLDATEAGLPIYLKNGFEPLDRAVRLERPPAPAPAAAGPGIRRLSARHLESLAAFDSSVFGADRTKLFRRLMEDFPDRVLGSFDAHGEVSGVLVAQPRRLGPWVATDREDAEALLRAALTLPLDGPAVVVAPEVNQTAHELLTGFGFLAKRASHHMKRGEHPVPGDRSNVYGMTSFAIG